MRALHRRRRLLGGVGGDAAGIGRLSQAIIDLLANQGPLDLKNLYSILQNSYWDLSRGLTSEEVLREEYFSPIWKQGLIAETPDGYVVGPQWEVIHPYQEVLKKALENPVPIEQLAKRQPWLEKEKPPLT